MYIELLPQALLDDITSNRCIPFVGAGFSRNSKCKAVKSIPDWDGLGQKAATYLNSYVYNGAIEALSCYEDEYSRANLVEMIARELHINEVYPGEAHLAFCRLYFDLICTTNFDFLLETSFGELYSRNGKPYHVVTNEGRLSTYFDEKTTIIKLHGDFNEPQNMVITEKDFDLYINTNPIFATYIANLLITRTPLLIGYSFNDPDIRMLWSIINSRLNNLCRRGYALMVDASPHEISRFMHRGIKVINLPGQKSEYAIIFEKLFKELLQYWEKNTQNSITTTNEDAIGSIKYYDEEINPMCFFSVPFEKLSLYKKYVFPIAKRQGLTPVSLDEFVLPSDNWIAKVQTLIKKSQVAIVDISTSNSNVFMELGMLKERNTQILVIDDNEQKLPTNILGNRYIFGDFDKNLDTLLMGVDDFLSQLTLDSKVDLLNEPKRLFHKGEYNAAIVSSIRVLEVELTRYWLYHKHNEKKSSAVIPLVQLLRTVEEDLSIDLNLVRIREWSSLRNRVVHSDFNATKLQAKEVVNGTYEIIKKLKQNTSL
jgi:hypothetical protein